VQWRHSPPAEVPNDRFRHCIGAVDGWYLRILRPGKGKHAHRYWSQYKQYHALLFLVVVDFTGRIRWLSSPKAPGHVSETGAFSSESFPFLPQLRLLGDGAYTSDDRVIIPFALNELTEDGGVSADDKLVFNKALRKRRVIVEGSIGRLRQTWGILHHTFRLDRDRAEPIARAAAVLMNYLYSRRGTYRYWTAAEQARCAARFPVRPDDLIPAE